jgi:hypothetical protein
MKFNLNIKYSKKNELRLVFSLARFKKAVYKNNIDYKVFCIGFGKTGTTSLEKALTGFGFTMGNQAVGEILAEDWANLRSERIIKFCKTANAFQDIPFALPGLFKELDKAFRTANLF